MKNQTSQIAGILLVLAALFISSSHAQVSGSNADVPRIMSYQGQVITTDGKAMNGTHHITASLYSDPHGKNSVWQGSYDALVNNGIFNILLGSGATPLPDISAMDRPLWVGISVDRGEEMRPLSQLSSSPYSLNIPDKSVTQAKLAPDVQSALFGRGNTPRVQGVPWDVAGNTLGIDNWIGSNDDYAVEVHVYDTYGTANEGTGRVMRYEPQTGTASSPNIIGGYFGNLISLGAGSVICGGGNVSGINESRANFTVIGGGKAQLIDTGSNNSVIVAGGGNTIGKSSANAYIGSGSGCFIHDNASASTILGGTSNTISDNCTNSFIGGGSTSTITSAGTTNAGRNCTITGGDHLTAQSYAQTVMGHYNSAQGSSTSSALNGNDRLLIIGNGTSGNGNQKNAFEVSENGHSIVYDSNGSSRAPIVGATYTDNVVYAWGFYDGGGSIARTFGVSSITPGTAGSGQFTVVLNMVHPNGSVASLTDTEMAVVITPEGSNNDCVYSKVLSTNTTSGVTSFTAMFTKTSIHPPSAPTHPDYWLSCDPYDGQDFMFIVVGRPHH